MTTSKVIKLKCHVYVRRIAARSHEKTQSHNTATTHKACPTSALLDRLKQLIRGGMLSSMEEKVGQSLAADNYS